MLPSLRRRAPVALLIGALLAAAGCSSPNPRYYTLQPVPGAAAAAGVSTVIVGPVSVPAVLDRPQLVMAMGGNEVRIEEFNRWAAPLSDQIAATLVADLAQRLDGVEVWAFGQGTRADADLQVSVIVQRFELGPGAQVALEALWTLRRPGAPPSSGRSTVRESGAEGPDAAVAAQSRALARVADDIAAAVRKTAR